MYPKLTQSNKKVLYMNTKRNDSNPFPIFSHLKKTHPSYGKKDSTNASNQMQDKEKNLIISSNSNAHKYETSISSSHECNTKNVK